MVGFSKQNKMADFWNEIILNNKTYQVGYQNNENFIISFKIIKIYLCHMILNLIGRINCYQSFNIVKVKRFLNANSVKSLK